MSSVGNQAPTGTRPSSFSSIFELWNRKLHYYPARGPPHPPPVWTCAPTAPATTTGRCGARARRALLRSVCLRLSLALVLSCHRRRNGFSELQKSRSQPIAARPSPRQPHPRAPMSPTHRTARTAARLQWGEISSFDRYKRVTSVGRSERTVARAPPPSRWLARGRRHLHRRVFWLTNEESMRNRQDESLLSVEVG